MKDTRRLLKHLFNWLGYDVRRIPSGSGANARTNETTGRGVVPPDIVCASTVKEAEYYKKWSPTYPLFTPWAEHPDFMAIYEGVKPHTLVTADRCYVLVAFARYARHLSGDFAECGVYRGGTALLLRRVLGNTDKTLYLFDSFQGLPNENPNHDNYYRRGDFCNPSVDSVRNLLKHFVSTIEIRQGWIPDTFAGLEKKRYAFAHIDVDLYQPTIDCCKYFYSRLVPGGVMVFDDYGFPACRGEKDAVDEFFADKLEVPIVLPTGQALAIKT
jgi:O-methyltransferase